MKSSGMNKTIFYALTLLPVLGCGYNSPFCLEDTSSVILIDEVDTSGDTVTFSWDGGYVGLVVVVGDGLTEMLYLPCLPEEGYKTNMAYPWTSCISSPYEYGTEPDGLDTAFVVNKELTSGETYEVEVFRDYEEGDCWMEQISTWNSFTAP